MWGMFVILCRRCKVSAVIILNNPQIRNDNGFNSPPFIEAVGEQASGKDKENQETAPSGNSELRTLLEGLLESTVRALGASAGVVRVVSPNSQMLQIAGAVGLPAEVCEDENLTDFACGVCGKAAGDRGIHASDSTICAQRSSRHFFVESGKHLVAAPLEYRGKLIGVCTLFFAAAEAVPGDIARSLRPFAELIGIALDSARKSIENQRMQLMVERQSMANEIHDSLAHTLYYARMRMELLLEAVRTQNEPLALKCAQDVDDALESGQKTMREIITHFRCQMDPLGLQYALQTLVDEFRNRTDITMTYTNHIANLELELEHELQVFHIVREALANVETHSAATRAWLTIERCDNHYVFTIADNGAGYGSVPSEGHYGLMIMRERALRIGGEIGITSTEGTGTRVRLKFPESEFPGQGV